MYMFVPPPLSLYILNVYAAFYGPRPGLAGSKP